MKQETIIEGNKAVATFHGFSRKPRKENSAGWKHWEIKPFGWFDDEDLKYHTSWDWIMPVWIKFKNLHIKGITARHYHKQVCASFGNAILSGEIENAWSDAVMAINWYNNHQPKPTTPAEG